ncbi:sigma-70 family RNA polymerase sigma factor [Sinorhizobium meliloti]|nr:sigma-70 family RNA polymerase sigma factor [Sinorhizobium meliloti]
MSSENQEFKREMLAALPSLRAFAMSLIGRHDRADDLVQDTIMKAWAKQDHFEIGTNMKAWLFTILRNELYSQMRKRGREVQDSDGHLTETLAHHPEQYGSLDLQDFRRALEQLPPDQREAIILVGGLGLLLRGGRHDLRLCARNDQEPRQQGASAAAGNSTGQGRKRLRA